MSGSVMASDGTFWVYILENPQGKLYIGHTDDLERRLTEHNSDEKVGTKYTHKNSPWKLAWSQPHPNRSSAVRRERKIKAMKSARWIREHLLSQ